MRRWRRLNDMRRRRLPLHVNLRMMRPCLLRRVFRTNHLPRKVLSKNSL